MRRSKACRLCMRSADGNIWLFVRQRKRPLTRMLFRAPGVHGAYSRRLRCVRIAAAVT